MHTTEAKKCLSAFLDHHSALLCATTLKYLLNQLNVTKRPENVVLIPCIVRVICVFSFKISEAVYFWKAHDIRNVKINVYINFAQMHYIGCNFISIIMAILTNKILRCGKVPF